MISSKSDRLSAQPPWKKWKPTIQKAPQKTFFHMKFRPKWEFDPENVNKQKELPATSSAAGQAVKGTFWQGASAWFQLHWWRLVNSYEPQQLYEWDCLCALPIDTLGQGNVFGGSVCPWQVATPMASYEWFVSHLKERTASTNPFGLLERKGSWTQKWGIHRLE